MLEQRVKTIRVAAVVSNAARLMNDVLEYLGYPLIYEISADFKDNEYIVTLKPKESEPVIYQFDPAVAEQFEQGSLAVLLLALHCKPDIQTND